ncbi:relaxin receptor 1 [Nematostella vectensis]|nr:relaxin receptor 1 [Nematostella vectensis]
MIAISEQYSPTTSSALPSHDALGQFWIPLLSIQAVVIASSNALTTIVFLVNAHLRKRSYYLLINLALVDFLVGALMVPIKLDLENKNAYLEISGRKYQILIGDTTFCVLYGIISSASLFSLVCISLERMCATLWPFLHRTTDIRWYGVVMTTLWVCAFTFGAIVYWDIYIALVLATVGVVFALLTILGSYGAIFLKVKHQHAEHQTSQAQRRYQKERELAKTVLIVTAAAFLCWIPLFVTVFSIIFGLDLPVDVQMMLTFIQEWNSFANFVIYSMRMPVFRKALYKFVFTCSSDNAIQPSNGH